jgi:elongation factor Tu
MAKEKFLRTKPHVNIGTIGHVDHGKTTLTAAITKVLQKKASHRRAFVHSILSITLLRRKSVVSQLTPLTLSIETANRHYAHVDCPGHADYVKNMVTGAAQMDGAIVVVAATDGPMPQTREHILLARQVNVPRLVIFMNKCDWLMTMKCSSSLKWKFASFFFLRYDYDGDNTPIIRGSALGALNGDPRNGKSRLWN